MRDGGNALDPFGTWSVAMRDERERERERERESS